MKKALLTLAALASVAAASPVLAQPYGGPGYGGYNNGGYNGGGDRWNGRGDRDGNIYQQIREVERRLDRGTRNGEINWREARQLRNDLQTIKNLEYRYRQNGFNRWEIQDLNQRLDRLERQVQYANRDDDRRDGGYGYGYGPGRW
ncbi:MAG: hypothetical protein U1E50_06485 [Caulobacteraceae bacterium]